MPLTGVSFQGYLRNGIILLSTVYQLIITLMWTLICANNVRIKPICVRYNVSSSIHNNTELSAIQNTIYHENTELYVFFLVLPVFI